MNLKLQRKFHQCKKSLIRYWYRLMKPLATFLEAKDDERRQKMKSKITEEKAVRYIAEDIARYIVKRKKGYTVSFIIAEYMDEDDFAGYESLSFLRYNFRMRKKTTMGYYKFNRGIPFQEKIIEELKAIKGIQVEEEIETFKWERVDNYKKTCNVSYIG